MQTQRTARRTHGTGSLIIKSGAYYGKFRVDGRQVLRKLGPVRPLGTRDGLTKTQAEGQLRKLMSETTVPPVTERITVTEAAEQLIEHLEAMGRKPSTIRSYRCLKRVQIDPRIGNRSVAQLRPQDVERFVSALMRDGLAVKTVTNLLGLLHSIMEHAVRRGWAATNPCNRVDRPRAAGADSEIRFLDQAEVEALMLAVPGNDFGRVYRAVYLTAAMTGMRRGELIALRWQDVDWTAQRIRVRRNYVGGQFGAPKTRRGSRSIPLADRLGTELDRLQQASAYGAEEDLVFANPHTGRPLDGNALLRSFQRTLEAAGVRRVRFHDLRHTFGTRMAAAGIPMRTLQEWLGHRDFATTLIYADYAPGAHEVDLVNGAFSEPNPTPTRRPDTNLDTNLSETQSNP